MTREGQPELPAAGMTRYQAAFLAACTDLRGRIAGWAALGLFSIIASVALAIMADRLAHRQRLAAMSRAFERVITLPISYHAERGPGRGPLSQNPNNVNGRVRRTKC